MCCAAWSAPHHSATATGHKHVVLEPCSCLIRLSYGISYPPGLAVRELHQYHHPPCLLGACTRLLLSKAFGTNDTCCYWMKMQMIRHRLRAEIPLMHCCLHGGAGTTWAGNAGEGGSELQRSHMVRTSREQPCLIERQKKPHLCRFSSFCCVFLSVLAAP